MLKLGSHARERGTFHIVIELTDEADDAIVPVSCVWTLTDMDGNVINGRSAVVVVSQTSMPVTLSGADLAIIAGQTNERLFLAEYVYNSTYGVNQAGKEEATFIIDNLKAVS